MSDITKGQRKLTVSLFQQIRCITYRQETHMPGKDHSGKECNLIHMRQNDMRQSPKLPTTTAFFLAQSYFILTGSFTAFCMDTFLMQMPKAKG